MAQNAQKTGVNAITIGENQPFLVATSLSKDEIINMKNASEKFIPIQQILNNKAKLLFNEYPTIAGNFGVYKQDDYIQNISFNYNRSEGNLALANSNLLSDFKVVNAVDIIYNSLLSDRSNNEIWKLFVLLTLLFLVLEVVIQKFIK
jgi:hypothetical protein